MLLATRKNLIMIKLKMSIRIVSSNKEKQIFFPFTLYMKVKGKKI